MTGSRAARLDGDVVRSEADLTTQTSAGAPASISSVAISASSAATSIPAASVTSSIGSDDDDVQRCDERRVELFMVAQECRGEAVVEVRPAVEA